ncbi:MAG TPA: hypothetical protein PK971_17415, partial [Saprospiraceae bacterium]|nr:hypothetical protein [Saprospiraceae bacterium]
LYFLHVYLWAFAPWAFVLAGLMWRWLRRPWGAKEAESAGFGDRLDWKEAFSIGGFFVSFVALSLSKYKLPHYIFVTLPWASVLVANGWPRLAAWFSKVRGAAVLLFYLPVALVFVTAFLLLGFVFPTHDMLLWLPPSGLLGWLSWRIARHPFPSDAEVWVQRGVMATLAGMFVMNFHFYPRLLTYQSSSAAAQYAKQAGIPADQMGYYGRHGHALDFYSQRILPDMGNTGHIQAEARRMGALWLYTTVPGKADLDRAGIVYEVLREFSHFQVALLSPQFLNPSTRHKTLEPVYLLKIPPQAPH